MESWKLDISAD